MLSKFIYNDGFKRIPYTGGVYEISCKGIARRSFQKTEVDRYVDEKGVIRITTRNGEWFDDFSLAVVLAITYRNCVLPQRLLNKLDVIYKDGDVANFGLYNTVWKCPEGKLEHPEFPGFCYIPGFSRYLINQKGELLSPGKGDLLTPYHDENRYLMYGVQPDVGNRTIVGMHRLLSLAWLEYPPNVDKLDVNHLDTIKHNNELTNLEWATRTRNNLHAQENGLMNAMAVLTRNILTGETTRYYSMEEAARQLGLNGETIRQRVINGKDGRVYDGLQFKAESDDSPWIKFDTHKEYKWATNNRLIDVVHNHSGDKVEFRSFSTAAKFIGIKPSALQYKLSVSDNVVVNGHLVSIRNELVPST